jgi:hypothetical protein
MISVTISKTGVENLGMQSRAARLLIGAGFIAFVMTTPQAPLGWYAVLPLLAVFPIFTAIIGWDPLKAFFQHASVTRRALNFSRPARWIVGATGVALIGTVYVAAYLDISLGLLMVLPILGIYPVFAAIAGMDPVTALCNLDREWVETQDASDAQPAAAFDVIHGSKTSAAEQEHQHHPKAA